MIDLVPPPARRVRARSRHPGDAVSAAVGVAVRAVRAADRWGGLTVQRGHGVYAAMAPRLAGPLHRRISVDVVAWAANKSGLVVVDLGSGPGTLAADLGRRLPTATVMGVEPSAPMLAIARATPASANVRFVEGSAEHLPLPDASVDLVVSSLSAHHWDDLPAAVREIHRVLRPDGQAWLYDVRFATFTERELAAVRERLALPARSLTRSVPTGQGRLPLFAVIELTL